MTRSHPSKRDDIHPRSIPEDRSEGNLGPDPTLEHGIGSGHSPSGEPSDDDGAGNVSPRRPESAYGLEDADELEMGGDWSGNPS